MLSKTHILAALVVGILAIQLFMIPSPLLFLLLFCFSTLLPDIDSPHSKYGRKIRPLSSLFFLIFGHRGILHSIWIPLLILALGFYFNVLWIGVTIMSGYLLHLIVDAFTLGGVQWFGIGPTTRGFFKTGGFVEAIIFVLLLAALFFEVRYFYF